MPRESKEKEMPTAITFRTIIGIVVFLLAIVFIFVAVPPAAVFALIALAGIGLIFP